MKPVSIGIVAPSAQVPDVEFELGLTRMRQAGFRIQVHPQVKKSHLFFAGTDEARAKAFFDYASDDRFDVIWCARGGYGAMRLLPLLERMTREREKPGRRKLLVGYSDATALLEFAKERWGWSVLHGPMPGMRRFCGIGEQEWGALVRLIRGEWVSSPWNEKSLRFAGKALRKPFEAELTGGNLAVIASLAGTRYALKTRGKILFLEDIDETLYRVDRMARQLLLAGAFDGVRAVVLGDFLGCVDRSAKVLVSRPKPRDLQRMIHQPRPEELQLLRKELPAEQVLLEIFSSICAPLGIPLAYGLPAGHGPGYAPIPLGSLARLDGRGDLEIRRWSWARGPGKA